MATVLRDLSALLLLLVLFAPSCILAKVPHARRLVADGTATEDALRVGMEAGLSMAPLVYRDQEGALAGFEPLLLESLAQAAEVAPEVVVLDNLDDRIRALYNGSVDAVIAGFSVTPKRSELVEFVEPYYWSAGLVLFAPGGEIEGVSTWEDMAGKTVATHPGMYVLDEAAKDPNSTYHINFVTASTAEEAALMIAAGEAVAWASDSSGLVVGGNLTLVAGLEPILRAPYAVAVAKGNEDLADKLSQALLALVAGGENATLLGIERETYGALGAPPNPDLQALVANPVQGGSPLLPEEPASCGEVPTDSIALPVMYQPVAVWNVMGVQNYTCNGTDYTYLGWLVNAVDVETGKHAGYAFTAPGSIGMHVPYFVATDESNSTVLGTLINVREAGSVDQPSPVDPQANTYWYRRPAYEQTGVFSEPEPVLYLTKTNTTGGVLPPGTGPCQEGDPMISIPVVAIFTFYACASPAVPALN